jgi:protein TonB
MHEGSAASESLAAPAGPRPAQAVDQPVLDAGEKDAYLAALLKRIEGHKHYPRTARRRQLQGEISVSFLLLQDGEVDRVTLSGGHQVLRDAARQAIHNATPFPKPPTGMNLPYPVRYGMVFQLR